MSGLHCEVHHRRRTNRPRHTIFYGGSAYVSDAWCITHIRASSAGACPRWHSAPNTELIHSSLILTLTSRLSTPADGVRTSGNRVSCICQLRRKVRTLFSSFTRRQGARCRITSGGSDPTESVTENIPSRLYDGIRVKWCVLQSSGIKVRAHRVSSNGNGMTNPTESKTM